MSEGLYRAPQEAVGQAPWATSRTTSSPHPARVALLVFAAYYLGARLGLALTFQPLPVSVLWPCNATLFAAMLLLPVEMWWLVAAAALPAHLLSELMGGIPLSMVLCWYLSNVAEALIGAAIVRSLLGAVNPFATARGVVLYLGASIAAATVSSFLDSAFVLLNHWGGKGYWDVWSSRSLSNIAADLVIVPPVVTLAFVHWDRVNLRRFDEAAALYIGLAVATIVALNTQLARDIPAAQACLPVPFMLWAALRFGPTGASTAFAFVAIATIWGAGHGVGPFSTGSSVESAHAVQIYLLCAGPTLLCLAAAAEEMRAGVASLRLGERRFRLVLQATRDMVYERDMGTNELWWNQDGLKHLGYGHEGDLSDFDALAERIHPDDRARAASARDVPLARGEPLWETEFRLRRPNGTYTHVHEQGFIVRDAAGEATHMIATLEDISQRVDIEERARQLGLASQRTAMAEFAAIVSHEINQPMSSILTNVEAGQILLGARPPRTAELGEVLEAIRDDNLRASEVVRHIRHFANKGEVASERFDMNELARSVARLSLNAARRRGADIWIHAGEIPAVRGDPVHIQQVLLNLILNALDAMAQSPAHTRLVEVRTRVVDDGDMVEVAVRDRGSGIPPANLPRIFKSFFTTKAEGMGLGLSIAHSLVLAHGGEIHAENNAEGGATFRFTIPADVVPAAS